MNNANNKRYVVVYPTRGLMGAIASVAFGNQHYSEEEAEALRAVVAAKGATERERFDLARVVPAMCSVGVWLAMPKASPAEWCRSSSRLAELLA